MFGLGYLNPEPLCSDYAAQGGFKGSMLTAIPRQSEISRGHRSVKVDTEASTPAWPLVPYAPGLVLKSKVMQHTSVSTVAAVAEGSGYCLGARSKYYVRGSIQIYIYMYMCVYVYMPV